MEWTQEERDKEQKRLTDAMPQKCPNCGRNWSEWDGSGLWRCWKEQGGCGYGMTNSPDDSENMQTRIRELLSEVDRLTTERDGLARKESLLTQDLEALRFVFKAKEEAFDTARAEVEKLRGPGSPSARFSLLLNKLTELLGDENPFAAEPPETRLLAKVEQLRAEVQSLRADATRERLKRRRAEEWIRKWRERSVVTTRYISSLSDVK